MHRLKRFRWNNRGLALLMSYLVLSLVLVYSNTMVLRTVSQRMAVERARDRIQAQYLAQSAAEQMRVELEDFLTRVVYKYTMGNATPALSWLDNVLTTSTPVTSTSVASSPFTLRFDLPIRNNETTGLPQLNDSNSDGAFQLGSDVSGYNLTAGTLTHPLCLDGVPTIPNTETCMALTEPRAWITSVCAAKGQGPPADPTTEPTTTVGCQPIVNPLANRIVTIQAEARVGSVTKRIQARYEFELPNASVFSYAYFINNHGWFEVNGNQTLRVSGEVRANGDLTFRSDQVVAGGEMPKMLVNGDLFASTNNHVYPPENGDITGNPTQYTNWLTYWGALPHNYDRSARHLVAPGQPLLNGHSDLLAYGSGWDTEYPGHPKTDQERHEHLTPHDMPYLGNLDLYKSIAIQSNATLTYYPPHVGPDGHLQVDANQNLILENTPVTIHGVYDPAKGPDQIAGTSDDNMPLILVGYPAYPANGITAHMITIDGPVVIPGDVLIKASNGVTGQGTIYAGRNMHIVGGIAHARYQRGLTQRNLLTGQIRTTGGIDIGRVCSNGQYYPPPTGTAVPAGCI